MRRSLFGRFLLAFCVILLANLVLVMIVTLHQSQAALAAEYRYRLDEAADKAVADYLQRGRLAANAQWASVTNSSQSNLSGIYVAVWEPLPSAQNTDTGWSDVQAAGIVGDRMERVQHGERVYWVAGNRAYTAVPVGQNQQNRAVLLLGLPQQMTGRSWWYYAQLAFYTLLAVSVPTLLVAFVFLGQVTRPVSRMVQMADAVAQGDFSQRVGVSRQDEIGLLGNALNQMAGQLSVAEQTQQTFLAGVSHDLRTPLTTIKANTQAMLDQIISPEEQPEYLASTIEEIDRLRGMVDNLIDASHPQSKPSLQVMETDISSLVAEVIRQVQAHARQLEVTLLSSLPPGLHAVVDSSKIRQVLLNLLDNAMRFAGPAGQVQLVLQDAGQSMVISVVDTGPGLAQELADKVFQPFVKAQGSNGAGLGLFLCQRIITAHGGKITLHSEVGQGVTVTMTLPKNML